MKEERKTKRAKWPMEKKMEPSKKNKMSRDKQIEGKDE
jgi:hypothetical protein